MSLMNILPDAPLEPPETPQPRCPECGKVCDTVYYDSRGFIVGCDNCIGKGDAWEAPACFPDEE